MLPTTAAAAAKPTLLILSATGAQGSSVIEHLLKSQSLAINNGNSILRGTTRNPDSEVSKALVAKGVEMVKADFGDKASLLAAFQGVDIVFANTNFWDKEIVAGDQTLEVKQVNTVYCTQNTCFTLNK